MSDPQETGGVDDQAVDWFVRLQSDAAREADWLAFETWLQLDERHGRAFEAVEALWTDLDDVPRFHGSATPGDKVFALRRRRVRPVWLSWAPLGAAAAAVALAVLVGRPLLMHASQTQTVATLKGQRQSVVLPDGSKLELDGGSAVVYRFDAGGRAVTLKMGEAYFAVVHDPQRPFTVLAGDRRIIDVGTVFDVKRTGRETEVTVKEGELDVGASSGLQRLINLKAGAQLIHEDGQTASLVRTVDVDPATAWRAGRLVYRDASLETVVSDLNRHFQTPIHVKGSNAAELRFSGVLVMDSEDAVIGRLQAFLPVAVERTDGALWLSRRR